MPRTRDEQRAARAAALYAAGMTSREIAAEIGAGQHSVLRWIGDAARRRGPRGRADVPDDLILRLRDGEQLSFTAIAEAAGMSKTGARMRYYALTGRPRPGRPAATIAP